MDQYLVEYDGVAGLVRYRIEGFWDVATVDAFGAELLTALSGRVANGRKLDVLGDASAFAVQTAPVAVAFETLMIQRVLPQIGRLALVVGAMLNKLQVERSMAGSQVKIFLNVEQAAAWLNEAS